MGKWDQNGHWGDWLGACGVDSPGSGWRSLAGCCECGDEPSGSGATALVRSVQCSKQWPQYAVLQINTKPRKLTKDAFGKDVNATEMHFSTRCV
jgi:hypothetical protein